MLFPHSGKGQYYSNQKLSIDMSTFWTILLLGFVLIIFNCLTVSGASAPPNRKFSNAVCNLAWLHSFCAILHASDHLELTRAYYLFDAQLVNLNFQFYSYRSSLQCALPFARSLFSYFINILVAFFLYKVLPDGHSYSRLAWQQVSCHSSCWNIKKLGFEPGPSKCQMH